MKKETVILNNGLEMPAFGFGTKVIGLNKESIEEAVGAAIDCGYRLIDTAPVYATEKMVGAAIRDRISAGVVKREELFIVSKLWNTEHKFENVIRSCKRSLKNLGLDYVDLYLINWPLDYREEPTSEWREYFSVNRTLGEVDYTETWRGMEQCVRIGMVKSIGLSNFSVEQIYRVVENASIRPVVCQDECHIMLSQRRLMLFCRVSQIILMAYSPLGNPGYPGYHNTICNDKPKKIWQNSVVEELCKKYKKTEAQVALRFLVDNYIVPIPKATSIEHITENIDIGSFKLTHAEIRSLHDLDCQYRIRPNWAYRKHPRYPFSARGYWV